jgi:catechol 2,3-dioxygenase-like lactoylglutathione lyase family enzyme
MNARLGFDHCVIAVSDWQTSDDFYAEVLGARIPSHDEWRAEYLFDGWKLSVHGPGFDGINATRPVEPGNSDLCFVWPGPIADAAAHLERCGVSVELGPVPRTGARGAGTSLYFRDPDGSLLELISYVD